MPSAEADAIFMRRAIELAMRGRGRVEPNPLVGCVIVRDGRVIGEGWHRHYGFPHAEPNALAACQGQAAGSTAYVTLEPCCHTNKQTPPCVPRLIEAQVARVVVGTVDPNTQVAGRGIERLRAAGIDVTVGLLEADCRQLATAFFARVLHRRPYVTLKWAQTADGRIAGPGGARLQISNAAASRAVHQLRARCDAILVGIGTALADDPLLTARGVDSPRPMLRVVLDSTLRLPLTSQLVRSANEGRVLVYCTDETYRQQPHRRDALVVSGVEVVPLPASGEGDAAQPSLTAAMQDLGRRSGTHLLVEPGPQLAASFFNAGLADRVWVIRSPKRSDQSTADQAAATAPAAAALPADFVPTGHVALDGDMLTEYLNPRGDAFFAAALSADLRLLLPNPPR